MIFEGLNKYCPEKKNKNPKNRVVWADVLVAEVVKQVLCPKSTKTEAVRVPVNVFLFATKENVTLYFETG